MKFHSIGRTWVLCAVAIFFGLLADSGRGAFASSNAIMPQHAQRIERALMAVSDFAKIYPDIFSKVDSNAFFARFPISPEKVYRTMALSQAALHRVLSQGMKAEETGYSRVFVNESAWSTLPYGLATSETFQAAGTDKLLMVTFEIDRRMLKDIKEDSFDWRHLVTQRVPPAAIQRIYLFNCRESNINQQFMEIDLIHKAR